MKILQQELGKALRAKDVADYLGIDDKTVIKYYEDLGGMRLGSRYIFFERRFIDAIQERTTVDCSSAKRQAAFGQGVPDQEGSEGLGSRDEAQARQRVEREDRHCLLD
jgi:hypothetical protein